MKTLNENCVTPRQEKFLRAFAENYGNITEAANLSGVPRKTVYNWREMDPAFRKKYDDIRNRKLDFAEKQLFRQMRKGNAKSTIFFLRTHGKDRGYF